MGTYLNPGNSAFARALTQKYIDKTSLISVINGTINTAKNLTCISRPRRFGKSYAAQMLWDKGTVLLGQGDGSLVPLSDRNYRPKTWVDRG